MLIPMMRPLLEKGLLLLALLGVALAMPGVASAAPAPVGHASSIVQMEMDSSGHCNMCLAESGNNGGPHQNGGLGGASCAGAASCATCAVSAAPTASMAASTLSPQHGMPAAGSDRNDGRRRDGPDTPPPISHS
jgi:hypothetical protein